MQTFSFGTTPTQIITEACKQQCPNGYPMTIKNQETWEQIAIAVNQGIDSHLEAVTERSTLDNGVCNIHPCELHVLLRRLGESDNEEAMSLRTDILETLDIEEI